MAENINFDELKNTCKGLDAEGVIRKLSTVFAGRIVLASSMAAEDQVLTDMICRVAPQIEIFTLDTGRLPQETYDIIERTSEHYGIDIRIVCPDSAQVEQ